jgi:MFS family permease
VTRTFARLWAASLFSEIAEWMMLVALPVFIYQSTGSAGSTALAMAAGVAPMVVLSPVAGYVADRWDQGRTLSLVCAAQAVCVVPLLLHDDVWLVYTVMVAQSAAATLFEPARNALIPRIVSPGRIVAANGWMGFNSSGARLLGSSMGGILLAVGGMPTLIASYLGVLVIATALLARRFDAAGTPVAREPMWRMWLDGLAEFRRE